MTIDITKRPIRLDDNSDLGDMKDIINVLIEVTDRHYEDLERLKLKKSDFTATGTNPEPTYIDIDGVKYQIFNADTIAFHACNDTTNPTPIRELAAAWVRICNAFDGSIDWIKTHNKGTNTSKIVAEIKRLREVERKYNTLKELVK